MSGIIEQLDQWSDYACASAFGLAAAATACIRVGLLRLLFGDGDRLGLRLLSRDRPLEWDRLLGLGLRFL
jgi:hypothetical protein